MLSNKICAAMLCAGVICITSSVQAKNLQSASDLNAGLPYAPPCEAIQPQSRILQKLLAEIAALPKTASTKQHEQAKQKILDKFWQHVAAQGTPIAESLDSQNSRLIFLWRGAKHNARLIGGPSNDHEWLTRLPNTDIWFKEATVNNQFIGSYSFAVDLPNIDGYLSHYCAHLDPALKESRTQRRAVLQVQQLDPFNQKQYLPLNNRSGMRNENLTALPDAPYFIDPKKYPDSPNPKLQNYEFNSKILLNKRNIQIYQSQRLNPKQHYITAIFFDGPQYVNLLNVPKALDILVDSGKLPPIQAVFVAAPNDAERPKELTPNPSFSDFFAQELLPWLDQHLPNPREKNQTVLLGSSLGGLSSAYLALKYPQEISHVVPLSGSFWWQAQPQDMPNGMSKMIRELPNPPVQHWFISANSYESSKNNNGLSILETAPAVAADLKAKGQDVVYQNYVGGHSYAIWQVALQDALLHFFGTE